MLGGLVSYGTFNPKVLSLPPHGKNAKNVSLVRASGGRASRQRRPQNIPGEFFVDHTCIDCDTCRWMAPALLSCPTASIHTEKPPKDILEVQKTFPLAIDEMKLPGVYHCGYHSEKSYGATSYLIVHPQGNILVDSPAYKERLGKNIDKLGGARYMFLTHEDDVADHDRWSKRLGCERILHSEAVVSSTSCVEVKLYGEGPWSLGSDIDLVHTPGHSKGSVCLWYKPLKVLFTGDHVGKTTENEISIFERYNSYSVLEQLRSVRKLFDLEFEWILPGHGRRIQFKDVQDKNKVLGAFLTLEESYLLQPV